MAETRKKSLSGLISKAIIHKLSQPFDNNDSKNAATPQPNNAWSAIWEIDQNVSLGFIKPFLRKIKKNKNPSQDQLAKISRFLDTRWHLICNSELSYLVSHHYPLNQFCMLLAESIAPLIKKSPFEVLMPTLEIKEYDIIGDSLDTYDFHKPWKYVLSSDKKALIDVVNCLTFTKSDLIFRHLYLVDSQQAFLTKEEATRVACHSNASNDLFDFIKQAHKAKYNDGTIGSRLNQFARFLKAGGVHGQFDGSEFDAGKDAFIAISEFDDYLKLLSPEEKEDLFNRSYKDKLKNHGILFENGEDAVIAPPIAINLRPHLDNSKNVTLGEIWDRLLRQHVFDQAELLREKKLLDQRSMQDKKLEKKIRSFQDGFDKEHTHVRYCVDVASNDIDSIAQAPQNKDLYIKKPINSASSSAEPYIELEKKLDAAFKAFTDAIENENYKVTYSYSRQTSIDHFCHNIISILKSESLTKEEKDSFMEHLEFDIFKKLFGNIDNSLLISMLETLPLAPKFLHTHFDEILIFLDVNKGKFQPSIYSCLFIKITQPIIDVKTITSPIALFTALYNNIPNIHHIDFLKLVNLNVILDLDNTSARDALTSIAAFKKLSFVVYDILFKTIHTHFQCAFAKDHPKPLIPLKVSPLSIFQSKPKAPHHVKATALLKRIIDGEVISANKLQKYKDELEGKGDIAAFYAEWKSVNFSR